MKLKFLLYISVAQLFGLSADDVCAATSDSLVAKSPERVEYLDATPVRLSTDRKLRFAWGAEVEGCVDMSGHDMSSLGINAGFGFEWKWVRFFGVGAQADIMVSNSSRAIPLFVNFRTDFSKRRRLLFVDMRGGVALANFEHDRKETVPYVSGGVGVTLASGRTFSSHIIVGYTWIGQKECYIGDVLRDCPGLSYAQLRLGVSF